MIISQFEIWWVDLTPTIGMETSKTRPCLVVSSNALNKGRMIFVAPFLKGRQPKFYAVNVTVDDLNHLDVDRRVDLRQMRGVDKSRLKKKQGFLDEKYHAGVRQALSVLFA